MSRSEEHAHDRKIYDVIRKTKDTVITKAAIKRETTLTPTLINKSLKTLEAKKLIKQIKGVQQRWGLYMAAEFEPMSEVTGGVWYENGSLDHQLVEVVKRVCLRFVKNKCDHEVVKLSEVLGEVERSKILNAKLEGGDLREVMEAFVLDEEVVKVGEDGYRWCKRGGGREATVAVAALVSIPCGVCPRVKECTPDGVVSPATCEYFFKWLEF